VNGTAILSSHSNDVFEKLKDIPEEPKGLPQLEDEYILPEKPQSGQSAVPASALLCSAIKQTY